MKGLFNKSWKTTAAGIIAFAMLVLGEVQKGIDDDPTTKVNYTAIVEAASILWLGLSSRDNNVSSEQVGAGNTGDGE